MIQVDCVEVRKLKARLREINSIPFEEIEWVEGKTKVDVDPQVSKNWPLVGLNNADFVQYVLDDSASSLTLLISRD